MTTTLEKMEMLHNQYIEEIAKEEPKKIIAMAYEITKIYDFISYLDIFDESELAPLNTVEDPLYEWYEFIASFENDSVNEEIVRMFLDNLENEAKNK